MVRPRAWACGSNPPRTEREWLPHHGDKTLRLRQELRDLRDSVVNLIIAHLARSARVSRENPAVGDHLHVHIVRTRAL